MGCGTGWTARLIVERHPDCRVIGIDADPAILARARARQEGRSAIDFIHAPAERTGLPAATIDVALSTLVFHHLPAAAKEEAAAEVARVLRPGGTFLLVDVRPLRPRRRPLTAAERLDPRLGLSTNTPDALRQALSRSGLEVAEVRAPRTWVPLLRTFALRASKTA